MTTEATAPSPYLYLQCEDAVKVLVERSLFTSPAPAFAEPHPSWFVTALGTAGRQRPLGKNDKDGLDVYYVGVPKNVLMELLRLHRFPELWLEGLWHSVPSSLKYTLDLAQWRAYLDYYAVRPTEETEATELRPLKRRKLAQEIPAKRLEALEAMGKALAQLIKDGPDYAYFPSALIRCLNLRFLFHAGVNHAIRGDGHPAITIIDVVMANGTTMKMDVGFSINMCHFEGGTHHGLGVKRDAGSPQLHVLLMNVAKQFDFPVSIFCDRKRHTDDKKLAQHNVESWYPPIKAKFSDVTAPGSNLTYIIMRIAHTKQREVVIEEDEDSAI